MATSKTLTPTNETITIDAFQDEKPDYRHVADAEGKLADAVNALNGKLTTENSAYTPTITAGSGFSASQHNFRYWRFGKILKCMGRFNIDNAGSTDEYVRISLPSGMSCATSGVGSCGNVHLNKSYTGLGLSIRTDGGNDVFIQMGAGGKSSTVMGTGYVVVDFTVLLT